MTTAQLWLYLGLFAIAPAGMLVAFFAGAWVAHRCGKGLSPAPQIIRQQSLKVVEEKTNPKPRQELPRVQI